MSFEKLTDLIELNLDLQTLGSLTIKAGDQPQTLADSPVIRIGGAPVIPGSSLKGALRSSLEALLSAKGTLVCVPATAIPNQIKRDRQDAQYLKNIGRKEPCRPNDRDLCPVCSIFGTVGGNQGLSGSAIFLDARLGEAFRPDMVPERTHVAITRDTRSQSGGALVTNETVDAGVKFTGAIRLVNPQDWQVGALLHALEWLRQLGIGSKKTAGYGQLDIAVSAITRKVLMGGKWQTTALKQEEFLQAFVNKFEAKK
jgi:CRISPR-associated protein Csm3